MSVNLDFTKNIVKPEDFTEYTGLNLYNELVSRVNNDVDTDNEISFAERFIYSIENWCLDYLTYHYDFDGVVKDIVKDKFVRGVVQQMEYVLENSSIDNLSGLNQQNGVIPRSILDKISISSNAFRSFRLAGMANVKRY